MSQELHQNDLMFKLLRIYIVEYLSTVHGFKNFQHEAINMLALYILKSIKKMAIPTKRLISLQGVTIPNCLHLVQTIHQSKFVDILQLINFLYKQSGNTTKNMQAFYSGFQSLGRDILEQPNQNINQHKQQNIYANISYIPHVYAYDPQENPLPIRVPVDEGIKKPADYTYKHSNEKIEKVDKSVEKLGNYTTREMRKSLGILSAQEFDELNERPRKIIKSKQEDRQMESEEMKNKFSMINYI